MAHKLSSFQQNILLIFIFIPITLLSLTGTQFHSAGSLFYPAAGFYTGLYFLYRKRVLPGIIIGIFFSNLIFRGYFIQEEFYISFLLAMFFTGSNVIEAILFTKMIDYFQIKFHKLMAMNQLGLYAFSILIASFFVALIGTMTLVIFYFDLNVINVFLYWWIGSMIGSLIFTSLIINSYYHDKVTLHTLKDFISRLLYLLLFALITYHAFTIASDGEVYFYHLQLLIFFLYFVAVFRFTFYMIIANTLILIGGINLLYLPNINVEDHLLSLMSMIVIILSLSTISSIVRVVLLEREEVFQDMKNAKRNLEHIIESTNDLVAIEDNITADKEFIYKYLKNMFEIACEIYPIMIVLLVLFARGNLWSLWQPRTTI